jgi:hypothetical protein
LAKWTATYSLPVGLVAGPVVWPLSGGLPACVPRLLTPFDVSGCCVVPELEDWPGLVELEPEPLPLPMPLDSFEEPRLPLEEPLPDELPVPEELPIPEEPEEELPAPDEPLLLEEPMPDDELATSTPSALAVFSSMRPVAVRLLDFWNSRKAPCVFGPITPSSGPGSMPLLFKAAWTCFTFSFDMLPALALRALPSLPRSLCMLLPRSVCMLPDDDPRWLLLPGADGSLDFWDSLPLFEDPAPLEPPVCVHACGAITNTAPLSTRLDKTCVFFMFSPFL